MTSEQQIIKSFEKIVPRFWICSNSDEGLVEPPIESQVDKRVVQREGWASGTAPYIRVHAHTKAAYVRNIDGLAVSLPTRFPINE